jgi:hypothetical protein
MFKATALSLVYGFSAACFFATRFFVAVFSATGLLASGSGDALGELPTDAGILLGISFGSGDGDLELDEALATGDGDLAIVALRTPMTFGKSSMLISRPSLVADDGLTGVSLPGVLGVGGVALPLTICTLCSRLRLLLMLGRLPPMPPKPPAGSGEYTGDVLL